MNLGNKVSSMEVKTPRGVVVLVFENFKKQQIVHKSSNHVVKEWIEADDFTVLTETDLELLKNKGKL